jgi:hypothetical protein
VPSYQTADLHISDKLKQHLELAVTGRNLLQERHLEITGDNSNVVGIKREVYGGLTWAW